MLMSFLDDVIPGTGTILVNQTVFPYRNLLHAACFFFAASSISLAVAELINFTGSRSLRTKGFLFFINPTVMQTSESWILCFLEPGFFLTLNERLSASFRSLNVSKLEMVAGRDAELALVLVVVVALLITLLVVPTCDILFPNFGQKRYDFKSIPPHFLHQTRALDCKEVWEIIEPRPWAGNIFLYWNIFFCTETCN